MMGVLKIYAIGKIKRNINEVLFNIFLNQNETLYFLMENMSYINIVFLILNTFFIS